MKHETEIAMPIKQEKPTRYNRVGVSFTSSEALFCFTITF